MTRSYGLWKKTSILAVAGGFAFWVTNFAISRTPFAAEYRAALSIPYLPMLVEALLGGLIIGFGVSYFLLRFFDNIPPKTPILKALFLSFVVLILVTLLIEVPAKFLTSTPDALRYFLFGATFNALRLLALGIVVGYLFDKLKR